MTQSTLDTPTTHAPTAPARPKTGGGGLRIALFALIVLAPVAVLGYVYYDFQRTGGIQEMADGYKLVDLRAMSTFPMDQRDGTIDDVPPIYRALDGEKVVLEGEMYSDRSAASQVREFDLVYSIADCCYGSEPQIQHFVRSQAADGGVIDFYRGVPVQVRGTLRVDVEKSGGRVTGVYHLAVEDVQPLG